MKVRQIAIHKLNPAKYDPEEQIKKNSLEYKDLKEGIKKFGYIKPIVINEDLTIIYGHNKVQILKELGYDEVKCIVLNVDDEQESKLYYHLNHSSHLSLEELKTILGG